MATKKKTITSDDGASNAVAMAAFGELKAALATTDDMEVWLCAALAAWEVCPTASLSLLVEKITEHLRESRTKDRDAAVQRLASLRGAAREVEWQALALRHDPGELDLLLTTPWPEHWPAARDRVSALTAASAPQDPRIAMALIGLIDAMPYVSRQSTRFWSLVARELMATARLDSRVTDAFAVVAMKPTRHSRAAQLTALWQRTLPSMQARAAQSCDRVAQAATANEALVESAIARLDAMPLAARAKAKGEAEFLAEIYADPHDAGLREVFCDWLLERSDPRGELMSLEQQTNPSSDDRAREVALLKELRPRICGKVEQLIARDVAVDDFERGFLTRCTLSMTEAQAEAGGIDFEEWSTVEEIELPINYHYSVRPTLTALIEKVLTAPSMRSLRALHGLSPLLAQQLFKNPSLRPIEEVSFWTDPYADRDANLAACPTMQLLKSVKRLRLASHTAPFDWLYKSAMWSSSNVEHLWLGRQYEAAHKELDHILAHATASSSSCKLQSFELGSYGWVFRRRAGFGYEYRRPTPTSPAFSHLEIHWSPSRSSHTIASELPKLIEILGKIPKDLPREIIFAFRIPRISSVAKKAIEQFIGRFTQLDRCVLPWAEKDPKKAAKTAK